MKERKVFGNRVVTRCFLSFVLNAESRDDLLTLYRNYTNMSQYVCILCSYVLPVTVIIVSVVTLKVVWNDFTKRGHTEIV